MRVAFLIPTPLRPFAEGRSRIDVEVDRGVRSLGEALAALGMIAPGVRDRVLTERGEVRPHVNVFVGTESCRWTGGLATPIADGSEITILPAISGGSEHLEFYARPATMTDAGRHAAMLEGLPGDIGVLAGIVQGLAVHEFVASEFYGFDVPEERKGESHIRRVEAMLDRILAIAPRPLSVARPPEKRLVGVCHHFVLLLVAMLRAHGVPARARCGFGSYFNPPYFEDHWVCEYWEAAAGRWALADPQFDEVWRSQLRIDHDVLDVPRDRFLVAGDAWERCRAGQGDPARFGIIKGNLRGLWFIAGDLVRDLAALNKVETLPWDVWGAMPGPDAPLRDEQLALFDRLAALTQKPDASFAEVRGLYEDDGRLRVPGTVFNSLLQRQEAI
jgi:molybdopterin converting factor small subunit